MTQPVLQGVYPALITPVRDEGRHLDLEALERLIERVVEAGVHGLLPAGSTGEGPRLTRRQRVRLTQFCVQAAPEELDVIAGTFFNTVEEGSTELTELAEQGAAAALVCPPVRLPLDGPGCARYFLGLAEASPLPIVIYNIPALTGVTVPPDAVLEIAAHPSVIAIKDSSGDLEYLSLILDGLDGAGPEDFAVLTGTDTLLVPSLLSGAHGTIAASLNLVPELARDIFAAVRDDRIEEARRLQARHRRVVQAVGSLGQVTAWKAAVHLLGIGSGDPVTPGSAPAPGAVKELGDALRELGLPVTEA